MTHEPSASGLHCEHCGSPNVQRWCLQDLRTLEIIADDPDRYDYCRDCEQEGTAVDRNERRGQA